MEKDLRDKNIIGEYLQYVDEHYRECHGDANRYEASDSLLSYPRGTEEAEEMFLIVDSWDFIREFNEWANNNYGKELYEETCYELPEEEESKECFTHWLDYLTQDMWGFCDEYSVCGCCNQVIRTSPDSYSWVANYWLSEEEGEIYCEDCIKAEENIRNSYLESLQNQNNKANTIFSNKELEEFGYEKVNNNRYQSGWYDEHDDPEEILQKAESRYPDGVFIFSICDTGQFHTDFDLWVLKESIETDYEEESVGA